MFQGFEVSMNQDFEVSWNPGFRIKKFLRIKFSKFHGFRVEVEIVRNQSFSSRFQGYTRNHSFEVSWNHGFRFSRMLGSRFEVSGFCSF
jgi:hypothetical protein